MFWHWFVLVLWIFWLVVYWRGGLDILQDIRAASSGRDLIFLIVLTLVTTGLVVSAWGLTLLKWQGQVPAEPGAGLVLLGVAGTFYCRRHLGAFWTAENALQPGHQIVETGPYALVRHPIYTAAIVLYLGTGFVFMVWWNIILVLVAITIYVLKTVHEDHFLAAHLSGYTAYQRRVPYRLLPKLW